MTVLGPQLLSGHRIAAGGPLADEVEAALACLGAAVLALPDLSQADEENTGSWARGQAPLRTVVHDTRPAFGGGGEAGLARAVHLAWITVREVATGALIPGSDPGKVVLIAPPPDAGPHAEAAAGALENLVRTLSVEWARYTITTVVVVPGSRADGSHLAELVAFLCSAAGAYLSGCRLELGTGAQ